MLCGRKAATSILGLCRSRMNLPRCMTTGASNLQLDMDNKTGIS